VRPTPDGTLVAPSAHREHRPRRTFCLCLGVRGELLDAVLQVLLVHNVGIAFANKRTEAFWNLRTALERGTLGLPNDEALFDELMSLRWRPSASGGKIELESKADWTARVGRTCDKSDAVAMAIYQTVDDEMVRAFSELNASGRTYW